MILSETVALHAVSTLAAILILGAVAWIGGSLITPRRPASERLAAGVLCILGLGAIAMLQAWAGRSLLSHPWVIAAVVAVALAVAALAIRPSLRLPRPAPVLAVWAASALVVTLPAWWSPASVMYSTDMLWHQGWTRQLMAGDIAPTGGLYGGVPNAYPWLYHSIAAASAGILPGGVTDALLVVELLGVAALGLGMWLLCRELGLSHRAGTWAVALSVAGGGIGWLWARGPAAVTLQIAGASHRFHGDLLVGNAPTTGMGDVYPLLPRELGADLVPLALWLALRARSEGRAGWAAGATTGLIALTSPTAAVGALATQLVITVVGGSRGLLAWLRLLVPFAAVAGIWLIPLAVHAHRLGGLVNTSATAPLSPSLVETLVAFGVLTPLAVLGVSIARNRVDLLVLPLVPGLVTLAAAAASGASLPGGPALTRELRYLPLVAVGCCPAAGVGADVLTSMAGRARFVVAAVLAAAACASPALASLHLAAASHPWVGRDALSCHPGLPATPADVVAMPGITPFLRDRLSVQLFAQSGASPAWTRHARVRYAHPAVPSQGTRRQWVRDVTAGHGPTGPVTLALAPPRSPVGGAGSCTFDVSVVGRLPGDDPQRELQLDWAAVPR